VVVTEYETVTLWKDRYVPVPELMVAPVEIPDMLGDDTIALGAAYKAARVRLMQCNGQLDAIGDL